MMDRDEPNDYENVAESDELWAKVPAGAKLERLWGDRARAHAELLDACHRALTDPMPYQLAELRSTSAA